MRGSSTFTSMGVMESLRSGRVAIGVGCASARASRARANAWAEAHPTPTLSGHGSDARGDLGDQLARERQLVGLWQFALAVGVDQQQRVVVASEGGRPEVADDQRHILAHELFARVLQQVVALGREADAERPI